MSIFRGLVQLPAFDGAFFMQSYRDAAFIFLRYKTYVWSILA